MKKRVLLVEHDPVLVRVYAELLKEERERWDCVVATDGWQALEFMKQSESSFDVVVADLGVPGLNGAALTVEIKKQCPQASRIVLSELTDQEEVARSLNSIHQFLAKPFEVPALRAALSRIGALDAYLQDDQLKVLVGQLGALPSLPSLYVEIMKELRARNPSLERIADIIAQDPGMTARMLQIVNSAVLGLARKISSPFEAVQYLGLATVRSLVLSAHIFSRFKRTRIKEFSVERIWSHAIGTATLARRILQLEEADTSDTEEAYIAGMLHDIGKLMLADSLPGPFQAAMTLAAERQLPLHVAEQETYGATHAGVAGYLLGLWGLPAAIVEAVAFHHTPGRSDTRTLSPLAAVHVADALEYELSRTEATGASSALDVHYLADLGMADRLAAWRDEAKRLLTAEHE